CVEDSRGNRFLVDSLVIKGVCEVREAPIVFEQGRFRSAQIAHASMPNLLNGPESSGMVTVAMIEEHGKPMAGVLLLPKPNEDGKRVFQMQVPGGQTTFAAETDMK